MTEENALEIPEFLRRDKDPPEEPETEMVVATIEVSRANLDTLLARIDELIAQRDKLVEAISAHKKAAQRLIGRM